MQPPSPPHKFLPLLNRCWLGLALFQHQRRICNLHQNTLFASGWFLCMKQTWSQKQGFNSDVKTSGTTWSRLFSDNQEKQMQVCLTCVPHCFYDQVELFAYHARVGFYPRKVACSLTVSVHCSPQYLTSRCWPNSTTYTCTYTVNKSLWDRTVQPLRPSLKKL